LLILAAGFRLSACSHKLYAPLNCVLALSFLSASTTHPVACILPCIWTYISFKHEPTPAARIMAAMSLSESRELPDGLPFHLGDIIGTGAFATYLPPITLQLG
jgi:hypothetical protein